MQLVAVGHRLDGLISRVDYRRVSVVGVGSNSDQRAKTDQGAGDLENEVRRLRKDRSHLEMLNPGFLAFHSFYHSRIACATGAKILV
jgi:hypothetical protein